MKHKSLQRLSLVLTFIAAIALAIVGQQTSSQVTPSVEQLRQHIEYLASDKLEGRRTGSPGANLAAEYIAKQFSLYSLRRSIGYDTPGMSHFEADSPRRYLQEFPYIAGVQLGKANMLSFSRADNDSLTQWRTSEDWMPLGFS